jgi:polysaccharide biosynthesis protein PslH
MARDKLLYLVHRVPYPPNRGDRIRSYHLLRFLAERYEVHLATLADEPVSAETRGTLNRLCTRVAIEPAGGAMRWVRGGCSLATGGTATEGLFRSRGLNRTVQSWAREHEYRAAIVFCSSMLQYLQAPGLGDVPVIVDLVDVDSQKWIDYALHARGPKRWLYSLEGRRLREVERRAVERAAAVTLVSEVEAELFRHTCPNDRTLAVANGVDLEYFRPNNEGPKPWKPLPAAHRTNIVFIGALDYRANIDGVTWFAREVWPLLRRELPELTLGLVGRNPAPAVQKLEQVPGIRVFGNVPDVRPYLAHADAVVAPLRIARGIQNKVLEAMAMAKPVVCSPAALEGIRATPGEETLVAAGPADWTQCIYRLMTEESLRQQLSTAARRHVEQHYAWSAALQPLADLLGKLSPAQANAHELCPAMA